MSSLWTLYLSLSNHWKYILLMIASKTINDLQVYFETGIIYFPVVSTHSCLFISVSVSDCFHFGEWFSDLVYLPPLTIYSLLNCKGYQFVITQYNMFILIWKAHHLEVWILEVKFNPSVSHLTSVYWFYLHSYMYCQVGV